MSGHQNTLLVQLGNISQRTGRALKIAKQLKGLFGYWRGDSENLQDKIYDDGTNNIANMPEDLERLAVQCKSLVLVKFNLPDLSKN